MCGVVGSFLWFGMERVTELERGGPSFQLRVWTPGGNIPQTICAYISSSTATVCAHAAIAFHATREIPETVHLGQLPWGALPLVLLGNLLSAIHHRGGANDADAPAELIWFHNDFQVAHPIGLVAQDARD